MSIGVAAGEHPRSKLGRGLLYDWIMRGAVAGYSALMLGFDIHLFAGEIAAHSAIYSAPDSGVIVATLARVSQWMFVALLAILPIFRLRPAAKLDAILPRAGALAAACVPPFFMLLDRAPPSIALNSAAVILGVVANSMAIVTVSFLGRSFSLMPEARRLVTAGPYTQIRHPLYLCELLGIGALLLQYRTVLVLDIVVFVIVLQVARGRWEEDVLAQSIADFAAYRARTTFMMPRDPVRFLCAFVFDATMRRRSLCVAIATSALGAFALLVFPHMVA